MNVLIVLTAAAAAAVAVLSPPVSGAAYSWLYPNDLNKSNDATTTVAPPSGSTPTTLEAATTPGPREPTPEELKDCESQIGVVENGVHISTMRKYDMAKILEEHGGAPGKLNVTWNKDVPEFPVEDPSVRPLPDTDNATFWLYDYKSTDFKTYVRLEHGLLRNKGQKDEYVDVRGELYWTPPDFCNKARHATYSVNQTGFSATVSRDYCWFREDSVGCATPGYCRTNGTHQGFSSRVDLGYCWLGERDMGCATTTYCHTSGDGHRYCVG